MPTCAKCDEHFPNLKVIDGRERNLGSRKFCLSCSPFGLHNTRNILADDAQKKTCSSCKRTLPLSMYLRRRRNSHIAFYGACRECRATDDKRRALMFKLRCVLYKGGKCEKCGYSKYVGALDFHHRDPATKEFTLGGQKKRKFDSRITRELDKCQLLCCRCHREEHANPETLGHGIAELLAILESTSAKAPMV